MKANEYILLVVLRRLEVIYQIKSIFQGIQKSGDGIRVNILCGATLYVKQNPKQLKIFNFKYKLGFAQETLSKPVLKFFSR